jgi:T-complex protein 1 subunit theta
VKKVNDISVESDIIDALRGPVGAKQNGHENFLTNIITQSCISVLPKNVKKFDVDNVRIIKVTGGGILDSILIKGAVLKGDAEGSIKSKENAKVAVYNGGIQDLIKPDTQNIVNVTNPEELKNYNISEEKLLEERIKLIAESGIDVVVAGGNIGELAMHYFEQNNIMVIRTPSKFEIKRICVATGARSLTRLDAPNPQQCGTIDSVRVVEHGSTNLIYFENIKEKSKIVSLILRGPTDNILDDVERAVDDGVLTFKAMTKSEFPVQFLPGAGATEIELAKLIKSYGETIETQDQYAIKKFGDALEVIPKILAENSGANPTEVISLLNSLHSEGKISMGVDINGNVVDSVKIGIYDLLLAKRRALELATNVAVTILSISQLIMSRQSEMPNPPGPGMSDPDPY